jgi:hypothetical protein
MNKLFDIVASAVITGTVAGVVSTAALAVLANAEGKSAPAPTNSTSHWLHGDNAGRYERIDLTHSAVGFATHQVSAVFWAFPFQAWLASRPPRSAKELLRDAAVMSAIAAAVDYGVTPKRLTPGWELTLSKGSMAAAFASLAIGLATGALVSRHVVGIPSPTDGQLTIR